MNENYIFAGFEFLAVALAVFVAVTVWIEFPTDFFMRGMSVFLVLAGTFAMTLGFMILSDRRT